MDTAQRATAALAVATALALLAAPVAGADPAEPLTEPLPPGDTAVVVVALPEGGDAPEAAAGAAAEAEVPGPSTTASVTTAASVTADGAAEALPPAEGAPHYEGVPHLPSPNSLPPGTSLTPPPERKLDGLRDIWDAVQNDEITKGDALLLMITQRPRGKTPTEQMSPRPSDPIMFAPPPADPNGVPAPAPEMPPADPILPPVAP